VDLPEGQEAESYLIIPTDVWVTNLVLMLFLHLWRSSMTIWPQTFIIWSATPITVHYRTLRSKRQTCFRK